MVAKEMSSHLKGWIIRQYREGYSMSDIASACGRTYCSIQSFLRKEIPGEIRHGGHPTPMGVPEKYEPPRPTKSKALIREDGIYIKDFWKII